MYNDINVTVGGPVNADYPRVYKTKFLKPGIPFGLQVTDMNTKYVIKHNFDLGGDNITIPTGCILEFDGGSLNNGTLTLNHAKIVSYNSRIFGDDIAITPETSMVLRASWFGMSDLKDCSSILKDVLESLGHDSMFILDTNVRIDNHISVALAGYINIQGEKESEIGHSKYSIISSYEPVSDSDYLIEATSEGLFVSNVRFNWTISGESNAFLFKNNALEALAESDISFSNCSFTTGTYRAICVQGRGFYLKDSLISTATNTYNTERKGIITLVGKSLPDITAEYAKPMDADRGIFITDNRIHGGKGLYLVDFMQDPDNDDTAYYNVMINNNLCDVGNAGIFSDSIIRGLVMCNNAFGFGCAALGFMKFVNSVSDFNFSNNLIIAPYNNTAAICNFNFEAKDSNVVFKNINISNNNFECSKDNIMFTVIGVANELELPDTLKGFTLRGNHFGETSFTEGQSSQPRFLFIFDTSIKGVTVDGNINLNDSITPHVIEFSRQNSTSVGYIKDVFLGINHGFSTNITISSEDNLTIENVNNLNDVFVQFEQQSNNNTNNNE